MIDTGSKIQKQPAELLSLVEIFEGRYFKIPDYQRGYSWEESQLDDLKNDIENSFGKEHKHFTGTIVAARKTDKEYDIVDGQQRITSLVILLSCIYSTNKEKYSDIKNLFLEKGGVGNERYILEPNEETKDYFYDLILRSASPDALIKSHRNIFEAKKNFENWLSHSPDVEKIYKTVTSNLGFIFFTPKHDPEIGIMFEVINNRGKRLSELEKIKNYFIYYSSVKGKKKLRETINSKWQSIQENLSLADKTSNTDEDRFLRYAYLVFYEAHKSDSHHVYQRLKERYDVNDNSNEDGIVKEMIRYVNFLSDTSKYYKYLYNSGSIEGQGEGGSAIEKSLKHLRCQPVLASVMPLYLALMSALDAPNVNAQDRIEKSLDLLEKVNFRLYILPGIFNRADSKQGDLFFFAHEFYKKLNEVGNAEFDFETRFGEKKGNGNLFDWIHSELLQFTLKFCPAKKLKESLTLDADDDYDFYRWRDSGLRYFLACYEEKQKNEIAKLSFNVENILIKRSEVKNVGNDYLSIEHIWAKENRSDKFRPDHIEKRRLGNLVLMGMNANMEQQKDDIPKKIKRLQEENKTSDGSRHMIQISELQSFFDKCIHDERITRRKRKSAKYYLTLAKLMNDKREEELVKFALDHWRLEGDAHINND